MYIGIGTVVLIVTIVLVGILGPTAAADRGPLGAQ